MFLYITKDFNLSAFLWTYQKDGVRTSLEKTTTVKEGVKPIIFFEFRLPLDEVDTGKLVFDYLNGKCLVEPQSFAEAQAKLKDLIHRQRA